MRATITSPAGVSSTAASIRPSVTAARSLLHPFGWSAIKVSIIRSRRWSFSLRRPQPSRGADPLVSDLVGEQGIDLSGLGRGMAEATSHDLDRDPGVDQLGGLSVVQLPPVM